MPDGEGITAVTGTRGSDERMAEAFQALGDSTWRRSTGRTARADLAGGVRRAAAGGASGARRRTVTDPHAPRPGASPLKCGGRRRPRPPAAAGAAVGPATRWAPRWLAAAAVLLLGTRLGSSTTSRRPSGDEFRTVCRLACDRSCPPTRRFRATRSGSAGHPDPKDRVSGAGDDGRPAGAGDGRRPDGARVRGRSCRSCGAARGASVLWQVDVSLPNGERLASPTFITRVE